MESYDGCKLLIIGSFDLCYDHDIELTFSEVSFIRCPTTFSSPRFSDSGFIPVVYGGFRFLILAEEGEFEIVAESVDATIGKVFHYDRSQLQPGERIADWVKRKHT